jgi:hypothetical protein
LLLERKKNKNANSALIKGKFFEWCKGLCESKGLNVKDYNVDTAKMKATNKCLVTWLYGEYQNRSDRSPGSRIGGGGFGGFGRSKLKCTKE